MDWLEAAAKFPDLLREIYGDLAKPGVRQVGMALETVLGLGNTILWPVYLLNERARLTLTSNLDRFRQRMEGVDEADICGVSPEIGTPILEKFSHVTNDELASLYVEILAKASHKGEAGFAHPGFVNIVSCICPDEALLLRAIRPFPGVPFVEVVVKKKSSNVWATLGGLRLLRLFYEGLTYPENVHAYISNLEGMGILNVRNDIQIADEATYDEISTHALEEHRELAEVVFPDHDMSTSKGKIEITPYGKLFLDAVNPR